ncbi:disease resistance protein RPM1-like [Cornus florida]|uniref:disease resistance protein RPM1-like n=1 Tax=Cornus florida TaxID=4283 RepID=UPI0028A13DE6|nr:disease resistance protein RPM1-like [Cornus florida]XP_059654556.1 disease resistance protein RPM1-like [Cornus florida]XP_059654560.1 disease resistance protein RPM1-like [Cornus florida]
MAETAVSSVIDNLLPLLTNEAKLLKGVHKEVASIKDELEYILCFLKDADVRVETAKINDSLQLWVKDVRKVSYKIEDVIDEYILHLAKPFHQYGFITFFLKVAHPVIKLKRRHEIASEIQEIKTTIQEIKQRADRYGFSSLEQGSSSVTKDSTWHDPRVASLFIAEDEVVGIESLRHKLISKLLAEQPMRGIISLIGMGGSGKTTLAKKVYDSPRVTAHFDCHAWIPVSQSYKMEEILKTMIKKFYGSRKEPVPEGIDTMEEDLLIENLKEYLELKRYVVVFDDVWKIDFWSFIKHALSKNSKCSRVIVTTRNDDVASSCKESPFDYIHHLEPLSEDKAWELFCKKTFQLDFGAQCPLELMEFSNKIVRKCEGLPLAIVAISGLLSTKDKTVSEWEKAYNSLGFELQRSPHLTSITKVILLSYHDLPYYLKSCFLYLSIIPEDFSIHCGRLIRLWIAEGFVKPEKGKKTLEEVAKEYLAELIRRSLVQVSELNYDKSKIRTCRVHDLIRELIVSKSEELSFCQVVEDDSSFDGQPRRLSFHNHVYNVLETIGKLRIRSCFIFKAEDELPKPFLGTLFAKFKLLKVLDLEGAPLDNLPEEVGKLLHLRYLSVRSTKVKILPKFIGKLYNLQTLDVKYSLVDELPCEISKLHKLRHLLAYDVNDNVDSFTDVRRGVKVHEGIGHLKELQKLRDVEASHEGFDQIIKELENLRELRKLGITKLRRENGRALINSIQKMKHLNYLQLVAINEDEILDLQCMTSPPQCLQCLYLRGRLGKLPDWIPKLQNLVRLGLYYSGLSDNLIEALQALPNMLWLHIRKGYDAERLYFGAHGFQKLKKLSLYELQELNSLIIEEGALPLLEELYIGPSPQLKEVPSGIQHLKKLRLLGFTDMPTKFIERMRGDEGQDYHIVKHIPSIHCWIKNKGLNYTSYKLLL